jgi:hypothetical protein
VPTPGRFARRARALEYRHADENPPKISGTVSAACGQVTVIHPRFIGVVFEGCNLAGEQPPILNGSVDRSGEQCRERRQLVFTREYVVAQLLTGMLVDVGGAGL